MDQLDSNGLLDHGCSLVVRRLIDHQWMSLPDLPSNKSTPLSSLPS